MTAALPALEDLAAPEAIPGVEIEVDTRMPGIAFLATARADGREVGHAWSFVHGRLSGLFDVEVDAAWRRRGIGTALLAAAQRPARWWGAEAMILNATPMGFELYARRGFTRIGESITWWLHASEYPAESEDMSPNRQAMAACRMAAARNRVASLVTWPFPTTTTLPPPSHRDHRGDCQAENDDAARTHAANRPRGR